MIALFGVFCLLSYRQSKNFPSIPLLVSPQTPRSTNLMWINSAYHFFLNSLAASSLIKGNLISWLYGE